MIADSLQLSTISHVQGDRIAPILSVLLFSELILRHLNICKNCTELGVICFVFFEELLHLI